ncbi:cytochrome P450 [Phenylobacterium sp.]|uniref:cytochrome P450 n=1 Tax=Phenylobacterium sp. TaxID=1871053 RepID=UPI0035B28FA9
MTGELRRNVILSWTEEAYEVPILSRPLFGFHFHAVNDPDAIRAVLLDRVSTYAKPALLGRLAGDLLGRGIFAAEGEDWREQRRLMAPVFTPAAIKGFMPGFLDEARVTADGWAAEAPGVIDVAAAATATTFRVICRALCSSEPLMATDEAAENVAAALASLGDFRAGALMGVPWLDASPRLRRAAKGRAFIRDAMARFLAERRAADDPPDDFMTRLLRVFAETHPPDEAARLALENAVTFLVAGHETTANALSWALYVLSEQPDVQDVLAAEARDALTETDPDAIIEWTPYLRWVLDEVLRLYPPAPRIERQAVADDELCGHEIRKGDLVSVWPWVVHRHRALWKDPDLFDPENFSPEAKAGHHRFQYIPFGAGPRVCIGAQFALAEAQLILATWLSRYRFSPVPGRQVEVQADIALRPKGGLPLRVEVRS